MARYYKKYKHGGKTVPGMYKAQEGVESIEETNVELSPDGSRINTMKVSDGDTTRSSRPNPYQMEMMRIQAMKQQEMQQQQQVQQMMQQMKMQNDSLLQQNELLKTQIQKSDLINSARNTSKSSGSVKSPKRYGGGSKRKIVSFSQSGNGNMMKNGGTNYKKRR